MGKVDKDLDVLFKAVGKILANSTCFSLNVMIHAKKSCDCQKEKIFDKKTKVILISYSIRLESKIKKATNKRKTMGKDLKKLKAKGLEIGSMVICNGCGFKHPCCIKVIGFEEPYVLIGCKHIFPDQEDKRMDPRKIELAKFAKR